MTVGIYGRVFKPEHQSYLEHLVNELEKHKIDAVFYSKYQQQIPKKYKSYWAFNGYKDIGSLDLLIALGGDGTILDTIQFIRNKNIPVAGINMGRLGFLADIHKEEIKQLVQSIVENSYTTEERTLLSVVTDQNIFGELNFGLNEFTIHKRDSASMIVIHVYLNGAFLNSYWADGLIVATPTGSTAYSLSCGGPILFPSVNTFVITPVAPHNLNARPLIIPDNNILSFEVEGRANSFLCSIDSRFQTLTSNMQIAVKKADFSFKLIRLPENSYLKTLREKLRWGEDSRNS
ncbi:MAG: NAD kinase [Chitinophagales bacterium]|nr:NAD kinase [Chitinophagales bacterium]